MSGRVYDVTAVSGDSRLQSHVLEELSDARHYRRWLADLARPYLGDHPIEIGSGNGDYALEWASSVARFTATEADDGRYEEIRNRFDGHPTISTQKLLLGADGPAPTSADLREHSAAVAFNVLEHIFDHVGALRSMGDLVQPGGTVVLVVPAFPSALSRFDLDIGHHRRYTRDSVSDALRQAGLRPEEVRYINPVGLLTWYVAVKGLNIRPRNGAMLRLYDRTVVPIAKALDRRAPLPFGQSVFAVARVPGGRPDPH